MTSEATVRVACMPSHQSSRTADCLTAEKAEASPAVRATEPPATLIAAREAGKQDRCSTTIEAAAAAATTTKRQTAELLE